MARLEAADYVVVLVDDLERSLRFYTQTLGLELGHRSGPYAQLATGRTRIALYERGAMEQTLGFPLRPPPREAPGFELGFKVGDVDAAFDEFVRAGAESAVAPTDRPWGQRTAYLRDPDGHLIELAQDPRVVGSSEESEFRAHGGGRWQTGRGLAFR